MNHDKLLVASFKIYAQYDWACRRMTRLEQALSPRSDGHIWTYCMITLPNMNIPDRSVSSSKAPTGAGSLPVMTPRQAEVEACQA